MLKRCYKKVIDLSDMSLAWYEEVIRKLLSIDAYSETIEASFNSTQLNRKTRMQVSNTSMSISILSKQIIKTVLLYNFLRSVSNTSQFGGKINCLMRPKLI